MKRYLAAFCCCLGSILSGGELAEKYKMEQKVYDSGTGICGRKKLGVAFLSKERTLFLAEIVFYIQIIT